MLRSVVIRIFLFFVCAIAATGFLSLFCCERWDGAFQQAEYRLTIVGADGKPVKGVTLVVKDRKGALAYGYPVTEFCGQGTALVSDAKGMLVFHHARTALMEFGGDCRHLFFLFPMEKCRPPAFFCEFRQGGRTIHREDYRDFNLVAVSDASPIEWVTLDLHGCDRRAAKEEAEGMSHPWKSREYPVVRRTIRVEGAE